MRIIGKTLSLLLLIALISYLISDYSFKLLNSASTPYNIPNNIDMDISKTFLLTPKAPLSFQLSMQSEKLWLASTARLPKEQLIEVASDYTLLFEFLDHADSVVYAHEHSFQTSNEDLIQLNEQIIPQRFFSSVETIAAKSGSVYFEPAQYKTSERLRISVKSQSELVHDIAISLYQKQPKDSNLDPLLTWQRMSVNDKNNKAKWHALPADFIDREEQYNYAMYHWDPIAPEGIPQVDFQQENLYRLSPLTGFWPSTSWENQFDSIADNTKSVTFVAHQAGDITFNISHSFASEKPYQLTIKWYPPYAALPEIKQFDLIENNLNIKQHFQRGLIEVSSSIPVDVSAIAYQEVMLPDENHFISAYMTNTEDGIVYNINNPDKEALLARLDTRQYNLLEGELSAGTKQVSYQWLDKDNRVIHQESISNTTEPEPYQQVVSSSVFDQVSLVTSRYFVLPAHVTKIKVLGGENTLASMAVSFLDIQQSKSLPQEVRNWFDYPHAIKFWHELKPNNWQEISQQGNKLLLKTYHRPVFIAPEILAGAYQSNMLELASNNAIWRDLMVPYQPKDHIKDSNNQYIFTRVQSKQEVTLAQDTLANKLTQSFFYIRDNNTPVKADLTIANQHSDDNMLIGQWGRINHAIETNKPIIAFTDQTVHWYLNQQTPTSDSYQSRKAVFIDSNNPLSFKVVKNTDELSLLMLFYSLNNDYGDITLTLKHPFETGSFEQFTRRNQHWKLSPTTGELGYVMQSNLRIGQAHKMSTKLFSDLPYGEYQLDVSVSGKTKGYVALNQITNEPKASITSYKGAKEHD